MALTKTSRQIKNLQYKQRCYFEYQLTSKAVLTIFGDAWGDIQVTAMMSETLEGSARIAPMGVLKGMLTIMRASQYLRRFAVNIWTKMFRQCFPPLTPDTYEQSMKICL
jgi:hypothetical protein